MAIEIECIIKSYNEPQLDKCLESIERQTIPFVKVTHLNGVRPENVAHNMLLEKLTYDWSFWVNGDCVLYDNCHEILLEVFEKHCKKKYVEYDFGAYDSMLKEKVCCLPLRYRPFVQELPFGNTLDCDSVVVRKLKRENRWHNYNAFREDILVAVHMPEPTPFQVFNRFYARAVKAGRNGNKRNYTMHLNKLRSLRRNSNNKYLYTSAIAGLKIGFESKDYPTSRDREFEMDVFKKWEEGKNGGKQH